MIDKITPKELIKLIKEYNPYCEHITLTTIYSKLNTDFHVINHGGAGSGKSYSSLELIKRIGDTNQIFLDNTTTTKGLFQTFLNYSEQDILLDEANSLLKDQTAQDMIKLSMERKPLSWVKNYKEEETPIYKGNIIINTNTKINESVTDRGYLNRVVMNKEMTLSFVDYYLKEKKDEKLINYIRDRIKENKPVKISKEELEYIKSFIKTQITDTEEELGYSRRVVNRIITYFECTKKFFGTIKGVKDFIEPLAQLYIINHQTPDLIEAIVSTGTISKVELIEKLSREGGYSKRHARRKIETKISEGTLILQGRNVILAGQKGQNGQGQKGQKGETNE